MFEQISLFMPLCIMALALSMDAFSVSLSIGMQNIRLKHVALIGAVIGLFHMLLPFFGMSMGSLISNETGYITTLIGGSLLVGMGAFMFFSAFGMASVSKRRITGVNIVIIAFVVSVDSLPVGLGLGMFGIRTFLAIILFGCTSMIMAWIGMSIGKKAHHHLGKYGEICGGIILFTFGLQMILG